MEARRCHKCGSVMLPTKRMTVNFAFSSLEFACTRCAKKVSVPEKMMVGAMLFTGAIGLASADPIYMFGGIVTAMMPFYRRMRNPLMSEETLALAAGIIPDSLPDESKPAIKPKPVEKRSKAFDAAEAAIDRALADRTASKSLTKRPVAASERFHGSRTATEGGFGRRRS